MPGKKSKAKAAVQAPGDLHPPPKPGPPARTTHVPTNEVVDEYVKVVGVENVAGASFRVLDCALSVNEIKGLPAIPEDVCSMRERVQKLQQDNGEALIYYLFRGDLQAGPVALTKGVLSNFALGLYHWLSPAPMGIILQLSAETLTALFAMMQRAEGPQRPCVSVYHVPDADLEKEAGQRRMWSDPVKVKHWEERLDMDTHIFFRESKFSDRGAHKAIQSGGRRETLKGPAIRDLTQSTIFVTQYTFFALGMACPSPGIAIKYPVSRHPLPDPPSRTSEEYEATGYIRTPPNVVEPENVPDLMFFEPEVLEAGEAEEDPPATSLGSALQPPAPPAPRLSWLAPLKTPPGMEKKVLYMGDTWVIGTGVGTAAISVCPFTMEGLGPEDVNAPQCSMPSYHRWWIPPPMVDNMVRLPVAPGYIYFGFCPSSLVLTRATSASAMQCASMAMHETASLPNMQAESDGKVKYVNKKKQCKCPCPEKACNYPVFARVKCIVCASAIRMARTQNRSLTHAK